MGMGQYSDGLSLRVATHTEGSVPYEQDSSHPFLIVPGTVTRDSRAGNAMVTMQTSMRAGGRKQRASPLAAEEKGARPVLSICFMGLSE